MSKPGSVSSDNPEPNGCRAMFLIGAPVQQRAQACFEGTCPSPWTAPIRLAPSGVGRPSYGRVTPTAGIAVRVPAGSRWRSTRWVGMRFLREVDRVSGLPRLTPPGIHGEQFYA